MLVLKDLNETPALGFAERAGFHDANAVADLRLVFFIVGVKFGDLLGDFAKLRMRDAGDRANDDGLIHLVRDDFSDAELAERAAFGLFGSGGFCHGWLLFGCLGGLPGKDGFDAGDVAARDADEVWFLQLAALLLDAKIKNFLLEFTLAGEEFLGCEFLNFLDFHGVVRRRGGG
jgi:hypothetical protein